MIKAIREVGVDVPLVVRLSGTKVEEGRRILADSGEKVIVADKDHALDMPGGDGKHQRANGTCA